MNKEEIEEIVSNKLTNDLNFNEMQIRHETITDITNKCGTIQPCIIAMQPVVDWFNSKKLWTKLRREQEPYVGVLLNLIALLAANDIAGLTQNWVLSDMEEETSIKIHSKHYSIMKKAITYSLATLAFVGVAVLLFSTIGVAVFFLPLLAGAFK